MRRVIPGLSLALLFGLFASIQPAAAQITHFYVVIDVINCPSLPGPDEAPFDDVNHPCEPATGITFAVTNGDTGEAFGSCVSEVLDAPDAQARGQCLVLADIDTPLIVTVDTSTVPAGYLPVENSVAVTLSGTEPNPNMRFINVLQGGDEPPPSDAGAPPAQLPSTGTGPAGLMQLISFFR